MNPILKGILEVAEQERTVPSASAAVGPVGLFRVRKQITVSALVSNLLAAVQGDGGSISIAGTDIVVHRPEVITVKITKLRKFEFSPDFPVDVDVMRLGVSVDIRSIEIVTDEESGHPAVLVTTASSLKPDLMIVCDIETEKPSGPDESELCRDEVVSALFNQHLVPAKHQAAIRNAVRVAFGPRAIAQRTIVACGNGPGSPAFDASMADGLAKSIVVSLVQEKVVSTGLLFWFQLGYWLVRIIAELLKMQHTNQMLRPQGYVGQTTAVRYR